MTADSAVISYPSNLDEWGVHQIETSQFRTHLKRSWDDVDESANSKTGGRSRAQGRSPVVSREVVT